MTAKRKIKPRKKPAISPGLKEIRETPGLSAKIADGLNITRQAVSDWDKIPLGRLIEVERLSGIPRERLMPEIFRKR
jgi:hypothetical protein